jgi:hypothetical protein
MTYYDSFDCKVNCEEIFMIDELEINEAQDYQGYDEWLDSLEPTEREAFLEQQAFEQEQEKLKANFNFNPPDSGECYEGIAV